MEHVDHCTLINVYSSENSCLNTVVVADNAMKSRNLIKHRHNFSLDGNVNNVLDCVFALSLFTVVSAATPRMKMSPTSSPFAYHASILHPVLEFYYSHP